MNRNQNFNENGVTVTDKRKFCDLKRIEAVKSRQNEGRQRQAAIKLALSNIDGSATKNRKIIFTDENMKDDLFPENDEDDATDFENGFNVPPQFEGRRGHKLLKLQSRFGNDDRFRIDSRFAEVTDDEDGSEVDEIISEEAPDEYQKNMRALRKVLDVGVDTPEKKKLFRDTSSLRYDPTKRDSERFKRVVEVKKDKKVETIKEPVPLPQVSTERFYEINTNFREELAQPSGESFSLLKAFSSGHHDEEVQTESLQDFHKTKTFPQKLAVPKKYSFNDRNKFGKFASKPTEHLTANRFFITSDDPRLTEGVNFFCRQKNLEEIREEWQKGRENVQQIFQLKTRRSEKRKQNPRRKNRR